MSPRGRHGGYAHLTEAGGGDGFALNVRAFPEGDTAVLFANPADFGYGRQPAFTIGRPVVTGGSLAQGFATAPDVHVEATRDVGEGTQITGLIDRHHVQRLVQFEGG